jgi:hypothetical protein
MQQEEAASSYAAGDDLESPRVMAVGTSPDLVASLVHVSRKGKLPLTTTTSVHTEAEATQPLQRLSQHQYVVPQVDKQRHLQVSQIAASPSTKTSITSSIYSSQESPALDNARLTEPFSPIYPLHDSEFEERSPAPIDQCKLSSQRTARFPKKRAD